MKLEKALHQALLLISVVFRNHKYYGKDAVPLEIKVRLLK